MQRPSKCWKLSAGMIQVKTDSNKKRHFSLANLPLPCVHSTLPLLLKGISPTANQQLQFPLSAGPPVTTPPPPPLRIWRRALPSAVPIRWQFRLRPCPHRCSGRPSHCVSPSFGTRWEELDGYTRPRRPPRGLICIRGERDDNFACVCWTQSKAPFGSHK
jgi:hypothetical protein